MMKHKISFKLHTDTFTVLHADLLLQMQDDVADDIRVSFCLKTSIYQSEYASQCIVNKSI